MVEINIETSVPGVVALFGEWGAILGEPSVAVCIDQRLTISAQLAEFDFFIVDGYKMDRKKHKYFDLALAKHWQGEPLEFRTSSQLPVVSGLGTYSTLAVAVAGLLMNLSKNIDKNPTLKKKKFSRRHLSRKVFKLEKTIEDHASPLRCSAVINGGAIFINNNPKGSVWDIPGAELTWYVHKLSRLEEITLVIGYPKQQKPYTREQPKPLFSSPIKAKALRSASGINYSPAYEPLFLKLRRFVSHSGFAKDNIMEMGKITRAGIEALSAGDLIKVGELMAQQQNILTMLGACPEALKPLVNAGKQDSYGVTLTGTIGDAIVALSDEPEKVVRNIKSVGGEAVIAKVTQRGFEVSK